MSDPKDAKAAIEQARGILGRVRVPYNEMWVSLYRVTNALARSQEQVWALEAREEAARELLDIAVRRAPDWPHTMTVEWKTQAKAWLAAPEAPGEEK